MTDPELPRVVIDEANDDLAVTLRRLQGLLVQYPVAAQALFLAFAREGRAFAATEEGREWRDRLAGSALIRRARVVWDVGTLSLLDEQEEAVLPSKLVDAVVQASGIEALESYLSRLFESTFEAGE